MQNLEGAVRSLPLKVRFLGFQSDTLALAKAGWALSMRQQQHFAYDRMELQLAMRYETSNGGAVYAYTNPLPIGWEDIMLYRKGDAATGVLEAMSRYGFDVVHVGNAPQFRYFGVQNDGPSWASQFHPVDARPQFVDTRQESMEDFKFFRVAKPTVKDLIVAPADVPELLDLVMKAQKPMLDGVRKREKSRANEDWMRAGMDLKPAHEVQAQIITLAG